MHFPFCNVALPVPLRTTFTYAVPEPLRAAVQPGSRVLVPFRNKSLIGVVVDYVEKAPEGQKVREIARVLDFAPALGPKLLELAYWIAGYYLAPIGEVFRAMLPPLVELKSLRRIALTESGRQAADSSNGYRLSSDLTRLEVEFLARLKEKKDSMALTQASKLGLQPAALQKLQRLGLIEIRDSIQDKKRRTQRVIAWKTAPVASDPGLALAEKEERVRTLLQTVRGPLPIQQLLKLAKVSRAVVERMLRRGFLES